MSRNLKKLYATVNTFAQSAICFIFVCLAYYLDLYAALWQSAWLVWLAYMLMALAVVISVLSIVAGWMWALQRKSQPRLWRVLLWLPWVIFVVFVVALLGLLVLILLKNGL